MKITRRLFLGFAAAAAAAPSAFAMTEAERRAERTRLFENNGRPQPQLSPGGATMKVTPLSESPGRKSTKSVGGGRRQVPVSDGSAYGDLPPGSIVIETGEKSLHFIEAPGVVISYPIAVGREGAQWFGTTHVTHKRKNPDWRPTPSMRKKDPSLPAVVPAGPSNPMGVRAIYLAEGYLRIHGTNAPSSIGRAASAGCFRMFNEDVIDLYERVSTGAMVKVLR